MVLLLADKGEILMDGTEQELFAQVTGLKHYSTKIFFDELEAGDEITVKVLDLDEQDNQERQYRSYPIEGAQSSPESLINWMPSSGYRITCEQITQGSGGFKTLSWALYTS